MAEDQLDTLATLVHKERESLLSVWRAQVRELPAAKHLDTPTLNDHIPGLLEELVTALRSKSDESIPEALSEGSSPAHGLQRVQDGFDIEEVVAEYNILRGCIHDLADTNGISLQGQPFHILNRVFDGAIGVALQRYTTQRALEVQRRREEYLSFVAHDLRTPLNAISIVTGFLEKTVTADKIGIRGVQALQGARRNIRQLSALVDKILKENVNLLTEMGITLEKRKFDLWPLAEALIEDLAPLAGSAGTRLINEIPHDLAVCADASLIRRVFQNLLSNAITYTPRGEVIIGARERDEKSVECWVSDNGAGIPQERLEVVFEKLETDPLKQSGLGLGLSIVKTFVEAHEGTVTVESKEGVGSTFQFTLPTVQT